MTPRNRAATSRLESRIVRGLMLAPAGANVVMQLARPGVGRGVSQSPVTSGSLMHHPVKRTRTTLAYIWLAMFGGDNEREELRRSVDAQHRHVRSRPGEELVYDAFDAELQLWVAACMYVGTLQGYETLYGPVTDDVAADLLHQCSRFATTLQVPAHRWPNTPQEFGEYWTAALTQVKFDDGTLRYVQEFIDVSFLPRPLAVCVRPWFRLLVVGYLDHDFRDALAMKWDGRDQRRFETWQMTLRLLNRATPVIVARFPWNLVRYDVRRRLARGRPPL